MFYKSEGGKPTDNKEKVSYKFPKDAKVQIGDVYIPIGDIAKLV